MHTAKLGKARWEIAALVTKSGPHLKTLMFDVVTCAEISTFDLSSDASSGATFANPAPCNVHVTPQRPLIDEVLHIRVSDAGKHKPITMLARMEDDGKRVFSYAHYTTDELGQLDLRKSACQGGFYKGVEAMGLFWSMKQEPEQQRGLRIVKRDVTTPLVTTLAVYDGHREDLHEMLHSKALATSSIERWYMASHVTRAEVREGDLHGTLFIPEDGGPYHGLIDMFGGIGGTVEHRAALLASRGFATLALRYIDVTTGFKITTDLDYFKRAIKWLLSLPRVISDGVGMVGTSKGGEMAILTSIICPLIKAIVSIGATDLVTIVDKTYRGEVFPCVDLVRHVGHKTSLSGESFALDEAIQQFSPDLLSQGALPIERTNSRILMVYGEDDRCSGVHCYNRMMARMRKAGKPHLVETLLYPGAGHLLEPPYSPHYRETFTPYPKSYFLWGGDPVSHHKAQELFWPSMLQFLRHELSQTADCNTTSAL